MRLLIKAVVLTVVIFGAVNYMAYLHTGRSLFPMWLEKTLARVDRFKEKADKALDSVGTPAGSDQVFYKWTDSEGVMHYTSAPPPEGIEAVVVQVDPNANLTRAVTPPPAEPAEEAPAVASAGQKTPAVEAESPFPYSPEQIKKTLDDARNAQKMMNEKMQQQQRILDSL